MGNLIIFVLQIASFAFIARAIMSWFPVNPTSPIYPVASALYRITEPVLAPIRRILPPMGGIDLSTLLVIVAINFVLVPIATQL